MHALDILLKSNGAVKMVAKDYDPLLMVMISQIVMNMIPVMAIYSILNFVHIYYRNLFVSLYFLLIPRPSEEHP